jgi:tetratricopeptide (TPR) repeat protein
LLGVCFGLAFAQDAPKDPQAPDAQEGPKDAKPPAKTPYDDAPKAVSLETSETLFTVLSAINFCGYDAELSASDPVRNAIRNEVSQAVQASADMVEAAKVMCDYYTAHQQVDSSRTLAQFISLALYLGPPPDLVPKVKDSELPPDAAGITGFVPMVQNFYNKVGLHSIWLRHEKEYAGLTIGYHEPLSRMMFATEVYLKLPSAGYLGRGFTIYIDPLAAPSQVNARNYGSDYYIVISTTPGSLLRMNELRHTYLHYLLDPLALKYPSELKRLMPITVAVKPSPLDSSFKNDISLLVTECFIRAVEARTNGTKKTPETERQQAVQESVQQGYVLTSYFYTALTNFEKDPAGLRTVFGDWLEKIDVNAEVKRAGQVKFASQADSDVLRLSRPVQSKLLTTAEQRLNAGDKDTAQKLAQQALDQKVEDQGRALFILAEIATMSSDMDGARNYFLKALGATQEPKVIAWSHIYLGRIFDLQDEREAAVDHYKAALTASTSLPDAKAAAEKGIQQAYEPPHRPQQN